MGRLTELVLFSPHLPFMDWIPRRQIVNGPPFFKGWFGVPDSLEDRDASEEAQDKHFVGNSYLKWGSLEELGL